jgi:hypothetical protein
VRWKITIEGMREFGGRDTAEMVIENEFNRLSKGEIGLSITDGKSIMACLQQVVVKQQCEAYVLTRRKNMDSRNRTPWNLIHDQQSSLLNKQAWRHVLEKSEIKINNINVLHGPFRRLLFNSGHRRSG